MKYIGKLLFLTAFYMGIIFINVSCTPQIALVPTTSASSTPTSLLSQPVQVEPTAAPTPTPKPTPDQTVESQAMPTEVVVEEVLISPLGKANCRSLPFGTSRIVGYLRTGQIVKANGMDVGGEWISIQNPDKKDGSSCWVSKTTVKVSGDLTKLPFISAVQK